MRKLMNTLRNWLVTGWICLLASSSASAFTLMAPLGGPPWPAEHDWTVLGCGIRGYEGGYTHIVFGSHDYRFAVPFSMAVKGSVPESRTNYDETGKQAEFRDPFNVQMKASKLSMCLVVAVITGCSPSSRLTEKQVLAVAEPAMKAKFPADFDANRPYHAEIIDGGAWWVQGTPPTNTMGGTAEALVQEGSGKILYMWHTR